MNITKCRLLMNSFFTSQFNYCPSIWMFHSRGFNNKINRLHERCLRTVYNNGSRSSSEDPLDKDKSVSINVKNLQTFALEVFKVAKNLSAPIVSEIFKKRNNVYDLRNPFEFTLRRVDSVFYGIGGISHLGPRIWCMVPLEMNKLTTINAFRKEVKE